MFLVVLNSKNQISVFKQKSFRNQSKGSCGVYESRGENFLQVNPCIFSVIVCFEGRG